MEHNTGPDPIRGAWVVDVLVVVDRRNGEDGEAGGGR